MTAAPPLVSLYVPGDRPDRFDKAAHVGADSVIIDLEDSVTPDHKAAARRAAVEFLREPPPCAVTVRINAAGTPWHDADLDALRHCANLAALRVPKVIEPQAVQTVADAVGVGVQAVIETALGVENLFAIASVDSCLSVSLGEADLRSDLSLVAEGSLDWIRARLVVAARAAGLPAPMMSVFTNVHDLDGLGKSCQIGRAHGFLGRVAIHPRQVSVIRAAFTPSDDEVQRAHRVLAALDAAQQKSSGVALLPDGHMVDEAMRAAAERTVALAATATGNYSKRVPPAPR